MDFQGIVVEPLKEVLMTVGGLIPKVFLAMVILIAGYIFARVIRSILTNLFHYIHVDKFIDKIGLASVLRFGGIKKKTSELLSCLTYWIIIIASLVMAMKALGLIMVYDVFKDIVAYTPHVISGTLALIFGMLVAKVFASIVYVTAKNADMPMPEGLSHLTKWTIVIYVTYIYLSEVGLLSLFVGVHRTIILAGVVFALALAFGLGGKDIAAKYLDVFHPKKSNHH